MKRDYVLKVLFFGALWGLSEAVVGGVFYRAALPFASVPLTLIGLCVLTVARAQLRWAGSATLIAASAMLYKFLNQPFFACHLLGILLLGLSYDVAFGMIKGRRLAAAATVYGAFGAFAVLMTFVFRYGPWVEGGATKALSYLLGAGSLAALAGALGVPWFGQLGERLASGAGEHVAALRTRWASLRVSLAATAGLWALGVAVCVYTLARSDAVAGG